MFRDDEDAFAERQRQDYERSVAYYRRAHRRRRLGIALWVVLAVIVPLATGLIVVKLHDHWREQRWLRMTPEEQDRARGYRLP